MRMSGRRMDVRVTPTAATAVVRAMPSSMCAAVLASISCQVLRNHLVSDRQAPELQHRCGWGNASDTSHSNITTCQVNAMHT